jgi:hypothetical protein
MIGGAGLLALGLAVRVARRIPAVDRAALELEAYLAGAAVTPAMLDELDDAVREQAAAMGLETA